MFRATIACLALTLAPDVAAAQQPCTSDARRVVNELYRHMLERPTDPRSSHWIRELQAGRVTTREVVRQIASSTEHTERFHMVEGGELAAYERSVADLYRHILGREPDAAGLRDHAQLAQRGGIQPVIDRIVDSAEYDEQFGDWGVPGANGLRYCVPRSWAANRQASEGAALNQRRFRGMDTDRDGTIRRDEWRGSPRSFDVHDRNDDDVLSGTEIDSARKGWTAADELSGVQDIFGYLDLNKNGWIEAREFSGSVAEFNRLDLNNDDVLSREEMLAYRGSPQSVR
jgi:hypothetical protein